MIHNHNTSKPKIHSPLAKTMLLSGLFTLFILQTAIAGLWGGYAVIHEDTAVEKMVTQNRLPAGHHYYYTGRSNLPYAVIAIDTKYSLNSRFWNKIASTDQIIPKIKHLMPISGTDVTYGKILGPDGEQIGLWFSEYPRTIIQLESNNQLKVFSPYQPGKRV